MSKGIVRAGDWIINHKGLIRKVAEGSTVSEECNWPATVDDGFRLAKLPKPEGSIIANVYGELCAMRDDGIIIGHQNLLTRFRVKTFITGDGLKTFWHKDGTVNRDKVIDISRLPLSDAITLLPECVLTRLNPGLVSEQKPLDDDKANRPGGSSGTKENDHDSLISLVKELSESLQECLTAFGFQEMEDDGEMLGITMSVIKSRNRAKQSSLTALNKVKEAGL